MAHKKTLTLRRRFLNLLSRAQLEAIATVERPWHMDRKTLTDHVMDLWANQETPWVTGEVENYINQMFRQAG